MCDFEVLKLMPASSSTVLLRFGLFLGPIQIQFEIQMT
eukprot:COSAG03_NODE_25265_length_266_cov_5.173653_1_plen_37_part_10